MTEVLFRLLEIIAILLPLTGIFIQLSFRLDTAAGIEVQTIRVMLVGAGGALSIAGVSVAIVLTVRAETVAVRLPLFAIYTAFLLFTAVFWVLYSAVDTDPEEPQQSLSEYTSNNDTE